MTSELNLRDLAAGQACQNPQAFTGFNSLRANITSDPDDIDAVRITVEQAPDALTAPNEIHRARWAFDTYSRRHPDELVVIDSVTPSHFRPANAETDHAVVRAKGRVAQQVADLFSRDRVTIDPALRDLLTSA